MESVLKGAVLTLTTPGEHSVVLRTCADPLPSTRRLATIVGMTTTIRVLIVRMTLPLMAAFLVATSAAPAALAEGNALPSAVATTTVDYEPSDAVIANPERGFDHTINTNYRDDGSGYVPLDSAQLNAYRDNEQITQIVRVFYMEKFVDQPVLDAAWLTLVQADFDAARAAGVSIIPRFAYVQGGQYPYQAPYGDAPLDIVLGHIAQLGATLARNADVIPTVQAGFIGLWGEWYYTDYFAADPSNPGVLTDADWANRRAVVEALLDVLPDDRMLQVRTMQMKQIIEQVPTGPTGALTDKQAYDGSDLARIGHHNDCFLASPDDFGTFLSDPITLDQDYLALDSRFVPMGGETCTVNPPRSDYPSAAAEMQRYHYSYLNVDYNTDVLDSWGADGLENTAKRLGYRFVLEQSRVTGSAIQVDVRNEGWAAPYNPRPAELVLTSDTGSIRVPFRSDARTWAPGAVTTIAADACSVPAGTYTASLALPSASESVARNPDFAIRTANLGTWDATTGTNVLTQTLVSSGACTAATSASEDPELVATGTDMVIPLVALSAASVIVGMVLLATHGRRRRRT